MTERAPRPIPMTAVYNPDFLDKESLVQSFSVRHELLDRLLDDLRRVGQGGDDHAQHHLILGQSGMGKTTLLNRLRYAIEDDRKLGEIWLPLAFPEQQYNVARIADLLANWLDSLCQTLTDQGHAEHARELESEIKAIEHIDESEREARAEAILERWSGKLGKRLLLLIDNLDLILDRLSEEGWKLRGLLNRARWLTLIGTSGHALEQTHQYDKPFYEFFQVHELKHLSLPEVRGMLEKLSNRFKTPAVLKLLQADPARVEILYALTGGLGNPRLVLLLHGILASSAGGGDVLSDLMQLLDMQTPFFRAKIEALPAQAQQIFDGLAIHWHPVTASGLAEIVRLETNKVSAQLERLAKDGMVEKVPFFKPESRVAYQVADRLLNLWYLMRSTSKSRQNLLGLVEFLVRSHKCESIGDLFFICGKQPGVSTLDDEVRRILWSSRRLALTAKIAADFLRHLDETGQANRWLPLREALATIAEGTRKYLRRLAPEVRKPTELWIEKLAPEGMLRFTDI